MDPALYELMDAGEGEDLIEAIIKLRPEAHPPPSVERLVSHFGDIHTCKIRRNRILETRQHESVVSLKAPRLLQLEVQTLDESVLEKTTVRTTDHRRPDGIPDGSGVVVGIIDMGLDFAHVNFRNSDGSSRILALWDQTQQSSEPDTKYGYGRTYDQAEINRALKTEKPYETLGYHPSLGLPSRIEGSHGTHVTDIAAGNGRLLGSPLGMAPGAEIIFVHLGNRFSGGLANLGNSVRILEALDFIAQTAGTKNLAVNISIGKHASSHDGESLVEQAFDNFLQEAPGRVISQSCGNYYQSNCASAVQLKHGIKSTVEWFKDPEDVSVNEMEIWLSLHDVILVEVRPPGGNETFSVPLGETRDIVVDGRNAGKVYHRASDSTNGKHLINIFIQPEAPGGNWQVNLIPEKIADGRVHLWVERDDQFQSRFSKEDAVPTTTLGSIATGRFPIVTGAVNGHSSDFSLAPFSSSGPTVDGRMKPDLVAGGVSVLAARSASLDSAFDHVGLTRKSGSSMAAPQVCGTIACMFQAAGRPLSIYETRNLLLANTQKLDVSEKDELRVGNGLLDIEAAIQATEDYVKKKEEKPEGSFPQNSMVEPILSLKSESEEDNSVELKNSKEKDFCLQHHDEGFEKEEDLPIEPHYLEEPSYSFLPQGHLESVEEIAYSGPEETLGQLKIDAPHSGFYDSFTQRTMPNHNFKGFEVIAQPEERLQPHEIRKGDVLVRKALGEFIPEYISIIDSDLIPRETVARRGWGQENNNPGFYAKVVEENGGINSPETLSRRILDADGFVPLDTVLLRSSANFESSKYTNQEQAFNDRAFFDNYSRPSISDDLFEGKHRISPTHISAIEIHYFSNKPFLAIDINSYIGFLKIRGLTIEGLANKLHLKPERVFKALVNWKNNQHVLIYLYQTYWLPKNHPNLRKKIGLKNEIRFMRNKINEWVKGGTRYLNWFLPNRINKKVFFPLSEGFLREMEDAKRSFQKSRSQQFLVRVNRKLNLMNSLGSVFIQSELDSLQNRVKDNASEVLILDMLDGLLGAMTSSYNYQFTRHRKPNEPKPDSEINKDNFRVLRRELGNLKETAYEYLVRNNPNFRNIKAERDRHGKNLLKLLDDKETIDLFKELVNNWNSVPKTLQDKASRIILQTYRYLLETSHAEVVVRKHIEPFLDILSDNEIEIDSLVSQKLKKLFFQRPTSIKIDDNNILTDFAKILASTPSDVSTVLAGPSSLALSIIQLSGVSLIPHVMGDTRKAKRLAGAMYKALFFVAGMGGKNNLDQRVGVFQAVIDGDLEEIRNSKHWSETLLDSKAMSAIFGVLNTISFISAIQSKDHNTLRKWSKIVSSGSKFIKSAAKIAANIRSISDLAKNGVVKFGRTALGVIGSIASIVSGSIALWEADKAGDKEGALFALTSLSLTGMLMIAVAASSATGIGAPVGVVLGVLSAIVGIVSSLRSFVKDWRRGKGHGVFKSYLKHFGRINGPYHEAISNGNHRLELAFKRVEYSLGKVRFWDIDLDEVDTLYKLGFNNDAVKALVNSDDFRPRVFLSR